MQLSSGIKLLNTYQHEGLRALDGVFLRFLHSHNAALHEQLIQARAQPDLLARKAESDLLIALAPFVDHFLAREFQLEQTIAEKKREALYRHTFFVDIKRKFVQRRGLRQHNAEAVAQMDGQALIVWAQAHCGDIIDHEDEEAVAAFEKKFAQKVGEWLGEEEKAHTENTLQPMVKDSLVEAERYAAWATLSSDGKKRHALGRLFRKPLPIDIKALVPVNTINTASGEVVVGAGEVRHRDGFHLTDSVRNTAYGLDQAHYCIWCHEQGRDSCSQGIRDKKTQEVQRSPLGTKLAGCPLTEKISEMNLLKAQGYTFAPLAVAIVDNPMIAGTGHRICNDCMKACIYQKQEPVDIPQAETRNLEDVLALPYGFELYALLTRWNPLNLRRPFMRAPSGKKVLVVGLGPAGYTLSHHLLQEGHTVVAIDGLKIEPLPGDLIGRTRDGAPANFSVIDSVARLMEDLDNRILAGFGGVSEYGITVRWNKNYLKLLRIILERCAHFRLYGGIRFGNDTGTVTVASALSMGFDHIALCMGAGKPTVIEMDNGFARGVRQASDFLMGLQLTGAAKENSLANLQIRMPIVVIGGGLTAIDTATESLAYYIRQVERYAKRHRALIEGQDEAQQASLLRMHIPEERAIHEEFLQHGLAVIHERALAQSENRPPNFLALSQSWGGATVVYRKAMSASPAYTLNHEEIIKAMEEGIYFAERCTPLKVEVDEYGHARALIAQEESGHHRTFLAKSILIAAGTQPNTVLARELSSPRQEGEVMLTLAGKYFAAINESGESVVAEHSNTKPDKAQVLTHRFADGRFMSFFGDLHPSFFGNVVKAMASAKQGFPQVCTVLAQLGTAHSSLSTQEFFNHLDRQWLAKVLRVERLTKNIVEVVVHAPAAAEHFNPGQFYRLQNFESTAEGTLSSAGATTLAMEGLALTGAWVSKPSEGGRGEVGLIVMEMGGSADLCARLKKDEPIVLMGPTGTPTHIKGGETVLLAGGGLGNAVLFSIGAAFRALGSKVVYFAGYRGLDDRYHLADIESAADVVVWCCDVAPGFRPNPARPQDKTFVGNIVQAMLAYAQGDLGETTIALSSVHRLIAIGSDKMMAAVARARHEVLAPYLSREHCGLGSINSPMQCMMKEICSQCIQLHRDPQSGKTTTVFSCFNQDQDLDFVDFAMLSERLRQNAVVEKQTHRWIARQLAITD